MSYKVENGEVSDLLKFAKDRGLTVEWAVARCSHGKPFHGDCNQCNHNGITSPTFARFRNRPYMSAWRGVSLIAKECGLSHGSYAANLPRKAFDEWLAYGDVSPIEHGGIWLKWDKDRPNDCQVVKIDKLFDANEHTYQVSWCEVDVNDIPDIDGVRSYIGANEETTLVDIVIGAVDYWGAVQLGGTADKVEGLGNAKAEVRSYGIKLPNKQ